MSDDHEARLLLGVLEERWEEVLRLLRDRLPQPDRFVALARQCDVAPTVHARLARGGRTDILGPEIGGALTALRAKARMDNVLLLARLETALDVLIAAGIRPVAIKGVDTLHRLYASFDERALDDVDLLVSPDERDAAIAALETAGWTGPDESERAHWMRTSFEMPLVSPGPVGVAFEIHWSLGQARRYTIRSDEIIARAIPIEVAGRRILRLDDHDAVAHLLLHHVQHYFDRRLKWMLELGLLARARGFSWSAVGERLRAWGGCAAAGLALVHMKKLFPEMLPDEAFRILPADLWRRAATLPLRSRHPLDLFRGTRRRGVQLWLAAVALEHPSELPGYLRHRVTRVRDDRGEDS